MEKSSLEVVCEGWLTKSPPTNLANLHQRIWRAKWRRRWFSLTNSGELPGQCVLTYYTDRNCRNLKGVINLDHCEQVDIGLKLEEKKLKFDHVFDIKTANRTYYLAADTESEMKTWVNHICKVCGLNSTTDDTEYYHNISAIRANLEASKLEKKNVNTTPPMSPDHTSYYIPLSDCTTGRVPVSDKQDFKSIHEYNKKNSMYKNDTTQHYLNYVNDFQDPRFQDASRQLLPHSSQAGKDGSPLQSPTDSESVFTDDDWAHNTSSELNDSRSKRPSDSSMDQLIATHKFIKDAPPRPPKHINKSTYSNYLNLTLPTTSPIKQTNNDFKNNNSNDFSQGKEKLLNDETYDFPRAQKLDNDLKSARRHCYNNAAPSKIDGQIFRYDISPKPGTSTNQIFKYDGEDSQDEPASPHSQNSSTTGYSNLPSPALLGSGNIQLMPPPKVNRDLKPKRKLSDSVSLSSNNEPPSPRIAAPSVDRKLKPPTPLQEAHMRKHFASESEDPKKVRAAPSPTPPDSSRERLYSNDSDNEQIYLHLVGKMQYLDLDLDCNLGNISSGNSLKSVKPQVDNTVYKEVDFMKTQAFNITRNNLEKERQDGFHKK